MCHDKHGEEGLEMIAANRWPLEKGFAEAKGTSLTSTLCVCACVGVTMQPLLNQIFHLFPGYSVSEDVSLVSHSSKLYFLSLLYGLGVK